MKLSKVRAQKVAYQARESIRPRDVKVMVCADADDAYCYFYFPSGNKLVCEQPYNRISGKPMEPIKKGDRIEMRCCQIRISSNGYGLFVDYDFKSDRMFDTVRINGADAQALETVEKYGWE